MIISATNSKRLISILALMFALCGLVACQPDTEKGPPKTGVAAYYDGRVIKWIIPYSPGGGYDEYGRLIAPYLEKHTGARVDIVNLPGAGGMRGANEIFNSPKNGLTIGTINGSALVTNELAGIRGADYKIAEFEYLARMVADKRVFVVSIDSGYNSFEELWQAGDKVKIGATGLGGSTYVDAVIVNQALGATTNIIHGFDSSSVVRQAMLRGNIVGTWGSWGSALDSVDEGRDKIVLQSGRVRAPDLPNVPTVFEMADMSKDPARARAILEAWETLHEVGRPVAAPPGTDPERVEFLSTAFANALNDPELLAISQSSGRPFDYASGEQMRQYVAAAIDLPEDIRKLFVGAILGEL